MKRNSILTVALFSMLLFSGSMKAQSVSIGDILNGKTLGGIVDAVSGTSTAALDINGTWKYKGTACALQTEDVVKKIGASVVTSSLENKMNKQCAKAGIKVGACNFTFNNDGSFITSVGKKSYSGTYTFEKKTGSLVLSYLQLMNLNATVAMNGSDISLLFEANKLMKLLAYLNKTSSNSSIKTISSLLNQYDGAKVGFKLGK